MQNQVISCIKTRRSIRKYKPEQISEEQLNALLDAAIWAPSGSNSQSWLFTAIYSPVKLSRLNELVRQGFISWHPDDTYPAKQAAKKRAESEAYNFYYHAPTLIVASNLADYQNGMADCATALQNIMLAAASLGLGSCWINQLRWLDKDEAIREYLAGFGLPRDHTICGAVAVGYPDMEPATPPRKKDTVLIVR